MNRGAAILTAGLVALVLSGAALAGKPGSGGAVKSSGSVKLVLVAADGARTSASAPTFADWITYEVTTTASEPYVETSCFQNGKLVYKQSRGFFAGYYAGTQMYQLGPTQAWAGGAATCNARLHEWVNGSDRTLSTTGFDVGA
jgi:hypothetical protein